MQASTKCTLRTAMFVAALLIPGGCLALLAVALVRRTCFAVGEASEKAPAATAPAKAASAAA